MNLEDHWMDKYARQVLGYRELDKFVKGQAGLKYYDVPIEMIYAHEREKDRKSMEEWERKEQERKESRNALLELRTEEEVRGNGHDTVKITRDEKGIHLDVTGKEPLPIPEEQIEDKLKSITAICKQCDKHTIFCKCNDNKPTSNEHCDLKKNAKKRLLRRKIKEE